MGFSLRDPGPSPGAGRMKVTAGATAGGASARNAHAGDGHPRALAAIPRRRQRGPHTGDDTMNKTNTVDGDAGGETFSAFAVHGNGSFSREHGRRFGSRQQRLASVDRPSDWERETMRLSGIGFLSVVRRLTVCVGRWSASRARSGSVPNRSRAGRRGRSSVPGAGAAFPVTDAVRATPRARAFATRGLRCGAFADPTGESAASRPDANERSRRQGIRSALPAVAVSLLLTLGGVFALSNDARAAVLVSNVGQSGGSNLAFGAREYAQGFTTGPGGAMLESVDIVFGSISTTAAGWTELSVSVWEAPGDGNTYPGTQRVTLSLPTDRSNGTNVTRTFSAPANTRLKANTNYFVVAFYDAGVNGAFALRRAGTGEDSGGEDDWEISNQANYRNAGSSDNWSELSSTTFRIRVNGVSSDATASYIHLLTKSGSGITLTSHCEQGKLVDKGAFCKEVFVRDAGDYRDIRMLVIPNDSDATVTFSGHGIQSITDGSNGRRTAKGTPPDSGNTVLPSWTATITAADGITTRDHVFHIWRVSSDREGIYVGSNRDKHGSLGTNATAYEGVDSHLEFEVHLFRTPGSNAETKVNYTTLNLAQAFPRVTFVTMSAATKDVDYDTTQGTLTFAPGETKKTVRVPVTDDDDDEPKEWMVFKISNPRGDGGERIKSAWNYGEITNSELEGEFEAPVSHDGASAFTVRVEFDEKVAITDTALRDDAVEITGGSVTAATVVTAGRAWDLTVQPSGNDAVTLKVAGMRACTETGAVCARDGKPLSADFSAEVAGPPSVAVTSDATAPVTGEFDVKVTFSTAVTGFEMSDLTIANGSARRMASSANGTEYTVTVAPTPGVTGTISVSVPAGVASDAGDTGNLASEAFEIDVRARFTASISDVAGTHDGESAFTFKLQFSEEARVGFRTLRDSAFEVSGGTVRRAKRLERGSNIGWRITVEPDADGDVVVSLPVRACGATGAICTDDDFALGDPVSVSIPGPGSSPRVSISAAASPVTEGAPASFTLSRRGGPAAALTVTVSVSEDGSMVDGTAPSTATFAADSSTATFDVATSDDEAVESASVVTAAVSSGAGYALDPGAESASVTVEDDDAAPVATGTGPFTVDENTTEIATLAATDEDTAAADLAWSLAGGADRDLFTLSEAGVLAFKAAKDFESPDDADNDGSYEVTVRVTDGANPVDAAVTVELADVDDAAPALSSASVNEDTMTLGFDEALDTAASPASDAFSVQAGEAAHSVSTVSVSGSSVTLTLASAVPAGEPVTVSYTAPTGDGASSLQDAAGNPVAAFSDRAVTNATASRVSIAASSPAVTEGRAAAFTLRRTGGDTTVALTVAVSVSEAGSVLSGTPDSSVTFAADAAEATLSVATENDAVDEAEGAVTVSLSSGSDYTLDPDATSARVAVYDNDAATVTTLWSSTLKWTEMNDFVSANAKDFTKSGWTEDGDDFGVWYFTYDPYDYILWLRMNSSLPAGGIPDPDELTLHIGGATVEAGDALTDFATGKVATVSGVRQDWEVGDRVSVRLTRSVAADTTSLPGISVEDATVREADGVPLSFRVRLGEAQTSAVSVRYATSDGTAVAGQDYEAASGVLRFEPGQTSKTVLVEVFADEHNEGSETMTLTLSSPFGATISDATATGTITNTGPIPQAWLARFGRTVADQVLDAVDARLHTARAPGVEATVAGQALSFDTASEDAEALAARRDDEARAQALSAWLRGEDGEADRAALSGTDVLSERDLFTGTSFALTGGTPGEGTVSAWGRGVISNFDGRDGALTLDGEVGNLMLGADFTRGRATAGLMLSHARGRGGYDGESTGSIEASLTGLYPYGRYAVSERVSVWGTAGYGEGTLTVEPEGEAALETDMDLAMASVGVRGVLVKAPAEGGAELAVKSDAMAVRTRSDAVRTDSGNLAAAKADVTRLRVGLEGSRAFRFAGGASLTPSVELGMRHDGGDAETGFGADIGAGLAWSDPARGLSADARARGLLTHEDGSFSERGFAGSLAWDPAPGSGRGPSLSFSQTVGAEASGGVEALLRPQTAQALEAADDDGSVLERRMLEAKAGYGFALFDGRYTGTPELGFGMTDAVREVVLGWRLAEETRTGLAFGLDVEGARQESVDDGAAGHRLTLGFGWRLEGAGAERFELRFEGSRIEAANDGEIPEQRLGLSLTARW